MGIRGCSVDAFINKDAASCSPADAPPRAMRDDSMPNSDTPEDL